MQSMGVPIPQLFDMRALRWNRQRAAASYDKFAFLKDEAAQRLADRVDLMRRNFDLCLDLCFLDLFLQHCINLLFQNVMKHVFTVKDVVS